MLHYFQVLYSGYTLSPRRNWSSVVMLTYSQYSQYYGLQCYSKTLSTRSTKSIYSILQAYMEHLLQRRLLLFLLLLLPLWRLCCWCATLSSSVRNAHAVTLRNDLPFKLFYFYARQQYYCCTPDTTVNTTVGRCVGAWCCCVVQYIRMYGVRYFFLMLPVLAVLRGSILWVLLVLSVLNYSRKWRPEYCAYWEYEQDEYWRPKYCEYWEYDE